MRKKFFSGSLSLVFLAGLLVSAPDIFGMCGTTVIWEGSATNGCANTGITADVFDQNIGIRGTGNTISLVDGIVVGALTCDITISVTDGDAVITGSGNRCDGTPTDPARLYLFADTGRTISFNLVDSLLFSGTSDEGVPVDLLVTASGPGTIRFVLGDGQTVTFAPKDAGSGGTYFIVGMDDSPSTPLVTFENSLVNTTALPAEVIVGERSLVSFASQTGAANASGEIQFQPKASGAAVRLHLRVQDGGSFVIGGFAADLTTDPFLISTIDFTTLAGTPTVSTQSIAGAGIGAALQIINSDTGCPEFLFSDPFCQGTTPPPFPGFVLIAPAILNVNDQTYIQYIGTATNSCCSFTLPDECGITTTLERLRNGSAFIVDGPADDSQVATINLNGSSAIYFLSGVDNCGNVSADFTINTSLVSLCAGNLVFDVEAPLEIIGSSPEETGINVLSLQVTATGCPVTIDSTLSDNNFPARTFARQANGDYIQYNLGFILVNSPFVRLFNTSLIHTDTIHPVYEHYNLGNPNIQSNPTYVGGDSYLFPCHDDRGRPTIELINSILRVHTNMASSGVDFLFPNNEDDGNNSFIIFYNNGRCIDNGYGRNWILGTEPCFDLCDTTTDEDSHLNVFQTVEQDNPNDLTVTLSTAANDDCITEGIPSRAAIATQHAVQTIFLNNASNFSIGTNGDVGIDADGNEFELTVTANVFIDGSCFSFETRGGTIALPQEVGTTGEGGIFVDRLGVFRILNNRIASFATMVTKSRNGVVDLPSNQVFFAPRVGITEWQPNMSDADQRVLVEAGQRLSDYSMDWGAVIKTYCCDDLISSTSCYIPYDIEEVPAPCNCPAVTQNNLYNLPTVRGEVDQFQILRSRICDVASLVVEGPGFIRELVFLGGFQTGEGPFAFLVLQNDGLVGLGSAHKDVDSLEASIVLGVNGVMLVPNGDGNIELNEDVVINNVCHILSGTAFGTGGNTHVLEISSSTPKELRIKSTGVLDLSQFDSVFKVLEISGQVKLVCEPGARIVLNGGILRFSGQAQWYVDPLFDSQVPFGATVADYDDVRVRLSGNGTIEMTEDSSFFIPNGGFFGVETYLTCSNVTNINWVLNEQASIQIGSEEMPGGAFQIGDTEEDEDRSVSFRLELAGQGALFELNRQGFFGLASGIVNKQVDDVANTWSIGCLSNVESVSLIDTQGTMILNQIANGDQPEASLLAIGSEGNYTFNFDPVTTQILGGGNMIKVNCVDFEPESVIPTVTTFAGVNGEFTEAGIIAGRLLLLDNAKPAQPAGVTPQALFNYLATPENDAQASPKANVASDQLNVATFGYVHDTVIHRQNLFPIRGKTGAIVSNLHSLQIGAVSVNLDDASGTIVRAYEITGSV